MARAARDSASRSSSRRHQRIWGCHAYQDDRFVWPSSTEDAGRSGTVKPDSRPGLGAALADLDSGQADAIVALKVDRVSRSVLDFATLVARADARGWQLVTLDMPLDPASPVGKATRSMLAIFAQLERDFASVRTAEAMAIQREAGWPDGPATRTACLMTWSRGSGANGTPARPWRAVAEGLNDDGVPTSRGGRWWPMTCKPPASRSAASAARCSAMARMILLGSGVVPRSMPPRACAGGS